MTTLPSPPPSYSEGGLQDTPKCTVVASYTRPDGNHPAFGTVTFTPSRVLISNDQPTNTDLVPQMAPVVVKLNNHGKLKVDLMVTKPTWWASGAWQWKVEQTICHQELPVAWLNLNEECDADVDLLLNLTWDKETYDPLVNCLPLSINYIGTLDSEDDLPDDALELDAYTIANPIYGTIPDTPDLWVYSHGKWANMGPITGPAGPQGIQGIQGEVEVGATTSVVWPGPAEVVDRTPDDPHHAILDFTIPEGPQGEKGDQGTVSVDGTTTGAPGSDAEVVDLDPDPTHAELHFTIPEGIQGIQGEKSTVSVVGTDTLPPGSDADVTDEAAADPHNLELRFEIPEGEKGDTGDGAEINVANTVTLPQGQPANVFDQNSIPHIADLVFEIPEGDRGPMGPGINWKSTLPTYADLQAVTGMVPGDCYGVEEDGVNRGLWVYFGTGGWFHANIQIDGLASEDYVHDYVKDYVDAKLATRFMPDYQTLLDQADGNWTGGP